MSLIFIIRANHYSVDQFEWIKFDTKKQTAQKQGISKVDKLEQLNETAKDCQTIFLIPGHQVHAVDVSFPGKKKSLIKSLPFLVEENLGEPIENMHIVAGEEHANKLEAFALSHDQMRYWKQLLDDTSLNVRYLCAEYQLLRRENNCIYFDNMRAVVSTEQLQGNLGESGTWHFLKHYQGASPLQLIADDLPVALKKLIDQERIVQVAPSQTLLEHLAAGFSLKKPPTNLLVGRYQIQSPLNGYWNAFKRPLIAAACVALLSLGQLVLDNFQMQRQIDHLDQQMLSLYKEVFPHSRKIPDPVRQMRAKLNQQEASNSGELLPWLAETAPLLEKHKIELTNLRFDQKKNSLRLQLTAPDFTQMEQLNTALQSKGMKSQLGTLVRNKDSVSGLLTLGGR